MSERVLTLDMEGADLPGAGDPCITDIIPAALAAIDPSLPGACQQAASSLGRARCCSSSWTALATSS